MTTSRALSIVPEPQPRPVKLSFRGVGKSFTTGTGTKVAVLDDVTFDVRTGEFVCLIGPSGCGKSTILNLLAGLERPDAGEVALDGRPIVEPGLSMSTPRIAVANRFE